MEAAEGGIQCSLSKYYHSVFEIFFLNTCSNGFLYSSYWLSLFPQNTFYILLFHSLYITSSHLFFVYMEAISKASPILAVFSHTKKFQLKSNYHGLLTGPETRILLPIILHNFHISTQVVRHFCRPTHMFCPTHQMLSRA